MVFVLDTAEEFQILERGNEFIATVPLGFDDDADIGVSLLVALSPEVGALPGEFELIFTVQSIGGRQSGPKVCFDGLATRPLTENRAHRRAILIMGVISG